MANLVLVSEVFSWMAETIDTINKVLLLVIIFFKFVV